MVAYGTWVQPKKLLAQSLAGFGKVICQAPRPRNARSWILATVDIGTSIEHQTWHMNWCDLICTSSYPITTIMDLVFSFVLPVSDASMERPMGRGNHRTSMASARRGWALIVQGKIDQLSCDTPQTPPRSGSWQVRTSCACCALPTQPSLTLPTSWQTRSRVLLEPANRLRLGI